MKVAPGERRFKYRLWRVNIDGKVVEGRWRNALGAISGAASKLLAPEHDFTDVAIHVECIGQPEELPPGIGESRTCPHCDAGEPSVWDNELEWFAHPSGDKLKMCEHPWRERDVVTLPP